MAGAGKEPMVRLKVKHGIFTHDVELPATATVAELKQKLVGETHVLAEKQKVLFRGQFLTDGTKTLESLGVKDRCKLMMSEDRTEAQPPPESTSGGATEAARQTEEVLQKVQTIRTEVDKLERQVANLRESVEKGEKVAEKDFVVAGELLMRQILALDSIHVTEESRAHRKAEVQRASRLVDEVDGLKTRNSR